MSTNVETPQATATVTTTEGTPTLGCKTFSWSPEVHDLYGDAETILSKIDAMDMELDERRVYALLIETTDSAEVRFFEQVDGENWAVFAWQGSSLGDLGAKLSRRVLDNQGVHCVGEQVKALISSSVPVELQAVVPAPASPRAAFAHPLRAHGSERFIRATTALLC